MKSDNESYNIGTEMYELMKELFPICRSITGNGVRKTLQIISKQIPLKQIHLLQILLRKEEVT
jgi:aminopeptidase-like protein